MPHKVIVLGGGVAGMSAAHELIERGFEVVVLERGQLAGGKARSIPVERRRSRHERPRARRYGRGVDRAPVPGEHGFRFFPGFYKHVIDTMRRIPSFDGRTVADHLVPTTRVGFTQYGKPTFLIPSRVSPHRGRCRHAACATCCWRSGRSFGFHPKTWRFSARDSGRSSPRAKSVASASMNGSAGGNSSTPNHDRRLIRNSSPPGSRARSSPPRRAKPAREPSATCSCR